MHKRLSSRQSPRTSQARSKSSSLRGDSLIEVMFSVGVFGLVAIGSVGVMNRGLYTAQNSLEVTMARNEIDAQAEALRFIHAAYTAEKNANVTSGNNYTALWDKIIHNPGSTSIASTTSELDTFLSEYSSNVSCSNANIKANSFIINYRQLKDASAAFDPDNVYKRGNNYLTTTPTHPRLIFNDYNPDSATLEADPTGHANILPVSSNGGAQGIWVRTVRGNDSANLGDIEYFDFYIRTCWDRLGGGTPNTISTVIRLYNPDYEPSI